MKKMKKLPSIAILILLLSTMFFTCYSTGKQDIDNNTIRGQSISHASSVYGIHLNGNVDESVFNGNIVDNIANGGAGSGTGIIVANANCNENLLMGNISRTSDTNFTDSGTNTFGNATLNNFA